MRNAKHKRRDAHQSRRSISHFRRMCLVGMKTQKTCSLRRAAEQRNLEFWPSEEDEAPRGSCVRIKDVHGDARAPISSITKRDRARKCKDEKEAEAKAKKKRKKSKQRNWSCSKKEASLFLSQSFCNRAFHPGAESLSRESQR